MRKYCNYFFAVKDYINQYDNPVSFSFFAVVL